MPEGGIVFEINCAEFYDLQMPVCGYFGSLSYVFGHNHYLYAYNGDNGPFDPSRDSEKFDEVDITKELLKYYTFIHSYDSAEMRKPFHKRKTINK